MIMMKILKVRLPALFTKFCVKMWIKKILDFGNSCMAIHVLSLLCSCSKSNSFVFREFEIFPCHFLMQPCNLHWFKNEVGTIFQFNCHFFPFSTYLLFFLITIWILVLRISQSEIMKTELHTYFIYLRSRWFDKTGLVKTFQKLQFLYKSLFSLLTYWFRKIIFLIYVGVEASGDYIGWI